MSKLVNYIQIVPPHAATGLVAAVYAEMRHDLRAVAEPISLHSPLPELLAGAWSILRETLIAGTVRRGIKEAVAATVADLNGCPWCVDVHRLMLRVTGEGDAADALLRRRLEEVKDSRVREVMVWAAATRTPAAAILQRPPFSPEEAPEMIGTAVTFHYLTRMVNALLVETPLPRSHLARAVIGRIAPWLRGALVNDAAVPRSLLGHLTETELPADLRWPSMAPAVAGAFAQFAATVEHVGERVVPPAVREFVLDQITHWTGDDPGPSRHWGTEAIAALDREDQASARLALLAALAAYQIDAAVVDAFRRQQPSDDALVGTLAWASFTTARRIGTWLGEPRPNPPGSWTTATG